MSVALRVFSDSSEPLKFPSSSPSVSEKRDHPQHLPHKGLLKKIRNHPQLKPLPVQDIQDLQALAFSKALEGHFEFCQFFLEKAYDQYDREACQDLPTLSSTADIGKVALAITNKILHGQITITRGSKMLDVLKTVSETTLKEAIKKLESFHSEAG